MQKIFFIYRTCFQKIIQGNFENVQGLDATEASWAYDERSNLRILIIEIEAGSTVAINGVSETLNRKLYIYEGGGVRIGDQTVEGKKRSCFL